MQPKRAYGPPSAGQTLYISSGRRNVRITGISLAASFLLPIVLPIALTTGLQEPAAAADFKNAKRVIVPATTYPRRLEYSSHTSRESGVGPAHGTYTPDSGSYSIPYSGSAPSPGSKYGLVPPPPPVSPSLLPSSMRSEVPPPPPAPSLSGNTGLPFAPTHSKNMGAQKVSGDPTRQNAAARNIANSETNKAAASSSIITSATSHADTLIKQGKLQEAQALLEKYHKTYPTNKTLKTKLGEVSLARAKHALRQDNWEEGVEQARLALHYEGSSVEAKSVLDQALKHQGIDPKSHTARIAQGDLLYGQGKEHLAKVEYESANKIHSSHDAHIGIGNAALKQGKLKEAKANYQLALEKNPDSYVALRQLGIVRYKQKDVVGANSDLSRALVLNPEDKLAGEQLVELWHRQVSARPNDANAHLGLARAYQLKGDLKAAQNEYRTVVKIDAEHPNLPAARQSFKLALARQEALKAHEAAKTLAASGALQDAFNKASESVDLSPGDVPFRLYQAELAEQLGNLGQAKQLYLEVLRKDSKNAIAAQRIKALSGSSPIGGSGFDTGAPPLAPAFTSGGGLKATAGSLSGLPALASGSSTASGAAAEGAALPYLPGPYGAPVAPGLPQTRPSGDHVTNMGGFLSQLREHTLKEQKKIKDHEDAVRVGLGLDPPPRKKGSSTSSLAGLDSLGGLGAGASAAADAAGAGDDPSFSPTGLISSSDISKMLGGSSSGSSEQSSASGIGSALGSTALGAGTSALSSSFGSSGIGDTDLSGSDLRFSDPITKTATAAPSPATGLAAKPQSLSDYAISAGKGYLGNKFGIAPKAASAAAAPVPVAQAAQIPPTAPPIGAVAGGANPNNMTAMLQGLSSRFPAGIPASLAAAAANFMAPAAGAAVAGAASGAAPQTAVQGVPIAPNMVGNQANGQFGAAPPVVPSTSPFNANNIFNTQPGSDAQSMAIAQGDSNGPATRLPWNTPTSAGMSAVPLALPPTGFGDNSQGFQGQNVPVAPTAGGASLPASLQSMAANLPPDVQAQLAAAAASGNLDPAALASGAQNMSKSMVKNIKDAYRRLGAVESQNKQLVAELKTAQQQIKELQDTQKSMLKQKTVSGKEPASSNSDVPKAQDSESVTPAAADNTTDSFFGTESHNTGDPASTPKLRGTHHHSKSHAGSSSKGTASGTASKGEVISESVKGEVEKETVPNQKISTQPQGSTQLQSQTPDSASLKYLVPTGPVDHPPVLFAVKRELKLLHFDRQANNSSSGFGSTGFASSNSAAASAAAASVPLAASSLPLIPSGAAPSFDIHEPVLKPAMSTPSSVNGAAAPSSDATLFGGDGTVRLELTGVKVQQKNIRLQVTLRNNSADAVVIPGSTKAVVRIVGEPDQAVKIRFDKKSLAKGASTVGEIHLPGTKLDPTADVFIPKIVSTAAGPKDVHLTVPISSLNNTASQ